GFAVDSATGSRLHDRRDGLEIFATQQTTERASGGAKDGLVDLPLANDLTAGATERAQRLGTRVIDLRNRTRGRDGGANELGARAHATARVSERERRGECRRGDACCIGHRLLVGEPARTRCADARLLRTRVEREGAFAGPTEQNGAGAEEHA